MPPTAPRGGRQGNEGTVSTDRGDRHMKIVGVDVGGTFTDVFVLD